MNNVIIAFHQTTLIIILLKLEGRDNNKYENLLLW